MPPQHLNLIHTLNTFYTPFADLPAFDKNKILAPDPTTARHPTNALNTTAARSAGYSDAAIDVLYQVPYLDVPDHEMQIIPSDYPINYLRADYHEETFRTWREKWPDEYLLPSMIAFRYNVGGGKVLLSDVETGYLFSLCLGVL
ncbi:hypothetical protein ASPCADRAFT_2125 [Aspergillus carbonarius ITEM 5010]|uniref:Uncharacterized protein n=1 Tax=Aspergillus carbonarius (strain ITEM 5010) TaxID=602072 RepID=A0A1R3RW39_ASPC5|nr:hypothetical protein ASPCADRAFT_2125 [Aspergillus carbonarius ITEM 5010]